jgi:hypothetical protein
MKAKEEIALKCALGGGIAGLFLGVAGAVWTWQQNGPGFMTLMEAALQIILWTFACAFLGGGLMYAILWLAERKFGSNSSVEKGPALALQKESFLRGLQSETQKSCLDISSHVVTADRHLDAAEREFAEGAFAPFWDEIERAANELAAYKNEVEHLRRSVDVYKTEALELEKITGVATALSFPDRQLPDARPAAARFAAIVRKAQTNFQFAVIYEQRKTNQLLHAGFGTLGAAIYSLGESIGKSLDTLSLALNTKLDKLVTDRAQERDFMKSLHDRQKEQADRLDQIQNRDRPGI